MHLAEELVDKSVDKSVDTPTVQNTSRIELKLETMLTFAGPVCAIASLDVNNDGLDELVVVTTDKVHLLQSRKLTGPSDAQEAVAKVHAAAELLRDILVLQADAAA
jgi:hypothetical protein